MKVVEDAQKFLLKERVQFDLIKCRDNASCFDDAVEVLGLEVRDPNRTDPATFTQFDKRFPGFDIEIVHRCWPVNEEEIEVVEAQRFERTIE